MSEFWYQKSQLGCLCWHFPVYHHMCTVGRLATTVSIPTFLPNPSFCYVTHRYHHNMRQPYQPSCQQTLTSHQCESDCTFTTENANQELRCIYLSAPFSVSANIKPLNPELNPICYLLALLAHHFLHVSRIMVKSLTLRLLMSHIYGAHILDVSRSHTTTHHSR